MQDIKITKKENEVQPERTKIDKALLWLIKNRYSRLTIFAIITGVIIYSMVLWNNFNKQWDLHFQSPIQNWIVITHKGNTNQPELIKTVKARVETAPSFK